MHLTADGLMGRAEFLTPVAAFYVKKNTKNTDGRFGNSGFIFFLNI